MNRHVLATAFLPLLLGGCIEDLPVGEDTQEEGEPLTVGQLPQLSAIDVDGGKTTDWGATDPIITDRVGDSTAPETDMVAFYAAQVGDQLAVLLEVDGNITLPHTPEADFSHYELGVDIYTDPACENELGFVIVNHFTGRGGTAFHRIESYDFGYEAPTTVASAGSYLETRFAIADLPSNTAAVSFNPYIQISAQPDYIKLDEMDEGVEDVCYPLTS